MVIRAANSAKRRLIDGLPVLHDQEAGSRGVTDGGQADLGDPVTPFAVDGIALWHIGLVGHHGIAAKVVGGVAFVTIDHQEGIGALIAQIGRPILFPTAEFLIVAHIIHGIVRPISIVGQHGDGVAGAQNALGISQRLYVDHALDKSATGVKCVQLLLLGIGKAQRDRNFHRTMGRKGHTVPSQSLQEEVHVICTDLTVAIQVGVGVVLDRLPCASYKVQERLGIIGICFPVAVEIPIVRISGTVHQLSIHGPGSQSHEGRRGGGLEEGHFLLALLVIGITLYHSLGKQLGGERKSPFLLLQVV